MKEMITTTAAMIGAACLFALPVTSLTIIALNIEAFVPFAVGALAFSSFTIGWLFCSNK